jgi:hypothetical protein
MDPELTHLDDLYHAHWRLKIIRHLLTTHRASPWKGSVTWRLQEADYLQRLSSAEDQLVLCRRKLADFHQRQEEAFRRRAAGRGGYEESAA